MKTQETIDYAGIDRDVRACSQRLTADANDAGAIAQLQHQARALGLVSSETTPAGPPRVSIIVLCRDQLAYTRRCLTALRRTLEPGLAEIILVDNGSQDGSADWAEAQPDLRVIRNEDNRGFGPANNQAAAKARGEYLVFCNNDTEPQVGWLESLLAVADNDPEVGAVGARLVNRDGVLLETGAVLNSDGSCTNRGRETIQSAHSYEPALTVDYASACALLVRKDAFGQVGGFDPRYAPAYYEDVDLCLGLRQNGYRIVVEPKAWVVHHESITARVVTGSEQRRVELQEAARRKFLAKWQDRLPLPSDDPLAPVRTPILPEPIKVAILVPYHHPGCMWGEAMNGEDLREAFEWRPDVNAAKIFSYATARELDHFKPDLLLSWTAWRYPLQYQSAVSLFFIVNYTHEFMPAGRFHTWEDALRLDADLYAANSSEAVQRLGEFKPASLLHLAANPRVHRPQAAYPEYRSQVTYLGSYNPGTKGQSVFDRYIVPATEFDLSLWGEMWERSPDLLRKHWQGKLPIPDIGKLYSSVDIAIGFNAQSQAAANMVNNRVFEVLSCGALLVSDRVPAIEAMFGDSAVFTDGYGDLRDKLAHYLENPSEREAITRHARERIMAGHTYDHRAREIIAMFADYQKERGRL
ncbi:MAG: glycosyltransferase [bacterium]